MQYEYTLEDGAHFAMTSTDVNDLLDIIHGFRVDYYGDDHPRSVAVHRVEHLALHLERGLERLERNITQELSEIQKRREQREPVEWEPADD